MCTKLAPPGDFVCGAGQRRPAGSGIVSDSAASGLAASVLADWQCGNRAATAFATGIRAVRPWADQITPGNTQAELRRIRLSPEVHITRLDVGTPTAALQRVARRHPRFAARRVSAAGEIVAPLAV